MTGSDDISVEERDRLLEQARGAPEDVDVSRLRSFMNDEETREFALTVFTSLARTAPVRMGEVVPDLVELLQVESRETRVMVARILSELAEGYPDEVERVVPNLREMVSSEFTPERYNAIAALGSIADVRPAAASDAAADVAPHLDSEVPDVSVASLQLLASVASHAPDAVDNHVEMFVTVAESAEPDRITEAARSASTPGVDVESDELERVQSEMNERVREARLAAVRALAGLSDARPSAVVDALPRLRPLLDDELEMRLGTVAIVGNVSEAFPDAGEAMVPDLRCLVVEDDNTFVRVDAAWALSVVADAGGDVADSDAADLVQSLRELLDHEDEQVRGPPVALLAYAAEERPVAVKDVAEDLREFVDASQPTAVRGNAMWALAYLGDEAALALFREVADSTDDDRLAETARAAEQTLLERYGR